MSVTAHVFAATENTSGCPVKPLPEPAVIVTTQPTLFAEAATFDVPSEASGAS